MSKSKQAPKTGDSQPDRPTDNSTFEDKVIGVAAELSAGICRQFPELRSLITIFDWNGPLNTVCRSFVWMTADGEIKLTDQDAIQGALPQTMRLLKAQTALMMEYHQQMLAGIQQVREQFIHESGNLSTEEKEEIITAIRGRVGRSSGGTQQTTTQE